MTNLGAVLLPQQPPERLREVVRAAEGAGLEELWLWEDCFLAGGISSAAAALAWSERLRVGVGVLPVPLRNVALTAMEIAAVERMFGGRAIWGVGHGVQDWMGQVGARVASPLTLLGEYLAALRGLLAGERITVQGRYIQLDDVALDWPPAAAPELLAAATGPRTLGRVGECADGVVLTSATSVDGVREAVETVRRYRAGVGRTGVPRVVVYVATATGPGAADRLHADLARQGREDLAGIGAAGDARAIADAVVRYAEAGADTVVLQPTEDADPLDFVRFVAEQVRPLVPA
ncbi:alkanesulfonate monooxygenase SsuD/methylene tetrahydromethanopterin reductase-like flavin-dependent oxidoreductase (luciferase family) [Nocardia sp. GAS34]|uniref:LLM class flavin-dependent oxidoreductase n=1 Tax=unclassified Nocardia TaxID=2637762 RepID=UPI003D212466